MYIRVTRPINRIDSPIPQPVIVCNIIAVAKNLIPSAKIRVIRNVIEANF